MTAALCALAFALPSRAHAQQIPDTAFRADVGPPAYPRGTGPVVVIDAAHFNFHTADDRFAGFARLLTDDGYVVRSSEVPFSRAALDSADVLVIVNALDSSNVDRWSLPTPSAFTADEIGTVSGWVRDGGALLLIADHMPFPGAGAELAATLGITFYNGFNADSSGALTTVHFRRSDRTLPALPVTEGRTPGERVDSVVSFLGQAFELAAPGTALLVMPPNSVLLMPEDAGALTDQTPRRDAAGMLQGAVMQMGRGRVAVFGEAAMFTTQLAGPERIPVGMNAPEARQNAQFALNVVHWLTGLI